MRYEDLLANLSRRQPAIQSNTPEVANAVTRIAQGIRSLKWSPPNQGGCAGCGPPPPLMIIRHNATSQLWVGWSICLLISELSKVRLKPVFNDRKQQQPRERSSSTPTPNEPTGTPQRENGVLSMVHWTRKSTLRLYLCTLLNTGKNDYCFAFKIRNVISNCKTSFSLWTKCHFPISSYDSSITQNSFRQQ
jgi:hypothetical protein